MRLEVKASSIQPIKDCLATLSWFGFPLRQQQATGRETTFIFMRRDSAKLGLLIFLTLLPYIASCVGIALNRKPAEEYEQLMQETNTSMFDIIATVVIVWLALINGAFAFCRVVKKKKELGRMFNKFEEACSTMNASFKDMKALDTSKACFKKARIVLWVSITMTLSISILQALSMYKSFTYMLDSSLKPIIWVITITSFLAIFTGLSSGALLGTELLINYFPCFTSCLIEYFSRGLGGYGNLLVSRSGENPLAIKTVWHEQNFRSAEGNAMSYSQHIDSTPSSAGDRTKSFLDMGLSLCDLIKDMESLFCSIYIGHFLTCILISIMALYSTSTILLANSIADLQVIDTITYFVFSSLFLIRMIGTAYFGQTLDEACKQAAIEVDRYALSRFKSMSDEERFKSRLLMDRLRAATPITPWGFFQVNHGMLVAAGSVVITYLIILVQFKDNARVRGPCVCNCNGSLLM